jgi:hypothetical protein
LTSFFIPRKTRLRSFRLSGLAAAVRHLNAQPVDPPQKLSRRFHPGFQTLPANEREGFHQRARGVAQQDPIHRKMNVGFQRRRIHKILLQVHRFP